MNITRPTSSTLRQLGTTLLLGLLALPLAASDPLADVPWRKLSFKASKLLITAHAEVTLEQRDSSRARSELLAAGDLQLLQPESDDTLAVIVGSRLLGRFSETTLLMNPATGGALQRRQVDSGKRQRVKIYRFGRDGVFSRRITPMGPAEAAHGPEEWTKVLDETARFPASGPITDPSALFYVLASADPIDYANGRILQAFSKGRLQDVEVRYVGAIQVPARFVVHRGQSQVDEVNDPIAVYHYALRPGEDSEDLQLLGLEGDLDLYIDVERRLPIQVSGKVSPVGRVNAKLEEAWLAH